MDGKKETIFLNHLDLSVSYVGHISPRGGRQGPEQPLRHGKNRRGESQHPG